MSTYQRRTADALSFGLALAGGIGLTLMILALGFGVVQGDNANTSTIGLAFGLGLLLFIIGVAGWLAATQPFRHFDDINQPMDTGHHHDEHHDAADAAHDEPHTLTVIDHAEKHP